MSRPLSCLKVLAAMPGTHGEIIARSGVERSAVTRWLRILHDAKEIHVSGWQRSDAQGPIKRVYTAGAGKDAQRLRRLPQATYDRRWRESHVEQCELYNKRRNARAWADKAKTRPTTWLSALGVTC